MNNVERIAINTKILELEKQKKFDEDVSTKPDNEPIKPGQVDYLKKKLSSKIKNKVSKFLLNKFIKNNEKNNKVILKDIKGIEKLTNIKGGAIITLNHFNPYDGYPIIKLCKTLNKNHHIVIAEHNWAGGQGFYGKIFRNYNTLPLAKNQRVLMECMRAIKYYLNKGDFVLIYPEQALWWNYRKPRPLKTGAFDIAVKNDVPVIACFITMQNSQFIDYDNFPVQEYTLHILDVLYPDPTLSNKENSVMLKNRNEELAKLKYEEIYKEKLVY